MNLPELIHNQRRWESERGITNGHYGIDRIQVELYEHKDDSVVNMVGYMACYQILVEANETID